MGYGPWDCKDLDTTERLTLLTLSLTHTHTHTHTHVYIFCLPKGAEVNLKNMTSTIKGTSVDRHVWVSLSASMASGPLSLISHSG